MNRMKTYDVPHKGIRNALSQLALLAGNTDYSNHHEVEKLYQLGNEVFRILTIHANDENDISLAELENLQSGASKHDRDEHITLHKLQNHLEELLFSIFSESNEGKDCGEKGSEFYFLLNEFYGKYLLHIAEEESVTQLLLWKHFTDQELAGHRVKIMGKHPPETLFLWFKFVIPAQNHQERVGLLSGFKKMAPVPFFNQGMEVIQKVLTENEYQKLMIALN